MSDFIRTIPTEKDMKYGMLVVVLDKTGGSYHSGCKVHFFNKKGVLVGNYYEFLPYDRIRIRANEQGQNRQYERFFYGKPYECLKMFFFKLALLATGYLMRFTQKFMN